MKVTKGWPGQTSRRSGIAAALCMISIICAHPAQASYTCYFDAFTSNGGYADDPGFNMYAVVSEAAGQIDFTFHNESEFESAIARIYFDNGSLEDVSSIINGPGVNFDLDFPGPGNLPAGKTLDPIFKADISVGAIAAPPHNGVNPQEWVKISFLLPAGMTLEDIADELTSGQLRVGAHIIGLPDGSSEAAILKIPEPASLLLLGLGGLAVMRRRRT